MTEYWWNSGEFASVICPGLWQEKFEKGEMIKGKLCTVENRAITGRPALSPCCPRSPERQPASSATGPMCLINVLTDMERSGASLWHRHGRWEPRDNGFNGFVERTGLLFFWGEKCKSPHNNHCLISHYNKGLSMGKLPCGFYGVLTGTSRQEPKSASGTQLRKLVCTLQVSHISLGRNPDAIERFLLLIRDTFSFITQITYKSVSVLFFLQ